MTQREGSQTIQYSFACSMQIWRRKAWEIPSHAVTSGRQRVDRQEAVLDEVLKFFLSCTISRRAGGQSISKVASIPLFPTPGLVQHEMGIIYVAAPCLSTLCLLDVTARDQISQAHNQILEVGMATKV